MSESENNSIRADASPEYVGFMIRFLAFMIDSIIASIVISPLVVMVLGGGCWVLGDRCFKRQIVKQTGRQASPLTRGGDRKSDEYRASN